MASCEIRNRMLPVFENQIELRERHKLSPSLFTIIGAQFITIMCPSGALNFNHYRSQKWDVIFSMEDA